MPTTRPRHTITETQRIAAALDAAQRRWPQEKRSDLLRRLIEAGHSAIRDADDVEQRRREAAVAETSGALSGVYPADYLEGLRREWPE